jgi:alpha-galactosidase
MKARTAGTAFSRRDLGRLFVFAGLSGAGVSAAPQRLEWVTGAAGCTQKLALVKGRFVCTSLMDSVAGREWIHPAGPSDEFLVRIADESGRELTLTGTSGWQYIEFSEKPIEKGWRRTAVSLDSSTLPIRLTRCYATHDRFPVIRQWTTVTNKGDRPLKITRLDSFRLRVSPGTEALELRWINNFGRAMIPSPGDPIHYRSIDENVAQSVRTGPYSPDCAWFSLGPPGSRLSLLGGWEWSGPMAVDFGGETDPCLISGGLDAEGMSEPLAPGMSFTSPVGWYGFVTGDEDDAAALSHGLIRLSLGPPLPEKDFPWVGYCTWATALDESQNPANEAGVDPWFPTEKNVLGQVEAAAEIGAELFLWDYGWFPRVGDWFFDPARFPKGPGDVQNAVRRHGMKLGLWCGFGNAVRESRVVQEHPEWLAEYHGKPIPDDFFIRTAASTWNTRILCLGHGPAREWVKQQLVRVIDQSEIDWFKHDFDLITYCQSRHHTHTPGDGRVAACEAFYEIMDFIRARYPQLVCEHWMNDSATPDYGVLQRHHVQLIGDAYDGFRLRQMVYGHTQIFPLDRQHRYLRLEHSRGDLTTVLRSSMIGGPWTLLSDPRLLTQEQKATLTREIEFYKRFRRFFSTGRVYRLIERPHPRGWDALQLWDGTRGEGVIYAFRNQHPSALWSVRLKGLQRGTRYEAEFLRGHRTAEMTGSKLMDEGLSVEIAEPDTCQLITLRRLG